MPTPRAHALLGPSALLATLLALSPSVLAQERSPREGTVVALDSGDLVVDLGSTKGAFDGELVELWRPVRLKHPVTGAMLTDRFRIGAVRLTQVQGTLSLAKLEGTPLRPVAAGDVVVMPPAEPPAAAAPPRSVPPPGPAEVPAPTPGGDVRTAVELDPDAGVLSQLMVELTGATIESRIAAYETFVRAHPRSRYAHVLNEEAAALRAKVSRPPPPAPYEHAERQVERARPGVPQRIAIELDARLVGAVLHARRKGAPGYRSTPMESLGPRYWSAVLPGDVIAEPGMEYFVEGVPASGQPVALVGTAAEPRDVPVDPAPIQGRSETTLAQAWLQSEYASFNAKRANDYVFQTEAAIGWRLRDVGLRAVRSGFGVIRGKGGTLDDLDRLGKEPEDVGLSYGWLEGEVAFSRTLAVIGRPILGLRQGGLAGGAQGFVRIGPDLRTNLLIGGEVLGGVGTRGIVELDWRTIHRVPIALRTEVTTQPAGVGSDVGARAIAQVGYELAHDFVVAARGSYQGRTIDHSGPGAGLAVSYQW